jgi:cytochrome b subunit of formate dehydrogenase
MHHWRKFALLAAATLNVFPVAHGATAPTNVITSSQDVVNLFCGALKWMFWGLIVLSVAMFLVGGYMYATATGDAEKVSKANKTLLYAAIAVVVALVALGAPMLIGSFFHVTSGLNACSL